MERIVTNYILSVQDDNQKRNKCLFTGDTGVCLALYLLAKVYNIPQEETEADKLFDGIHYAVANITDTSFDKGLSGIGWAVNLLNMHGCIEGDIDEIFEDVDAPIYKVLTKYDEQISTRVTNGLLGYLLYLTARLENPNHNCDRIVDRLLRAAIRNVVNKLYDSASTIFPQLSKDIYTTALWDFPILFTLLARVHDLDIFREKIESMVHGWIMYLESAWPHYNINRLSLAASLLYLNSRCQDKDMDIQLNQLLSTVDFMKMEDEVDDRIMNANEGWFYFLFVLKKATELMPRENSVAIQADQLRKKLLHDNVPRFREKLQKGISNISFVNGVSGIAVLLALYPHVFDGYLLERDNKDIEYVYGKRSHLRQPRT